MEVFLQVDKATRNYGDIELFRDISFVINKGDKVALIARNGIGKTTLLNILAGKENFDSGKYSLNKRIKIGYLEQDPVFKPGLTVFESVYGSAGKLMETVKNYEIALHSNDQKLLDEAAARMDFDEAWDLESRIKQTLSVFGIDDENQKINTLSGGQIKRLALAITLINEPDFLILDEPTNHLDLDMVEWLEEYLIRSRVTLLMVTHDRYFLERICNQIIEIDEHLAYLYKGNYRDFLLKRADRIQNKTIFAERARNLLRREVEWIRSMPKARGTKAKYRIDAYYDLQREASYQRVDKQVEIRSEPIRLGNKILVLDAISKRFDNKVILDNFRYTFTKGEKIGIIGNNGTGKTTFLNIITGELNPDQGRRDPGETVIFGYYKQLGISFKAGQRVIEFVQDIAEAIVLTDGRTITAAQLLNTFLFPPEMQYVQIEKLSGGERRRLYLLSVLMKNPNFLILDEPTNDFDIETLQVLEEYLSSFNGCLIIVSHDRFFMDKIVDHLFIFEGKGVVYDFPGNYSDYRASQPAVTGEKKNETRVEESPVRNKSQNITGTAKSKRTFREKKELEMLTSEIENLEKEKTQREELMSSGNLPADDLMKESVRIGEIIRLLDEKTDRWLELSE